MTLYRRYECGLPVYLVDVPVSGDIPKRKLLHRAIAGWLVEQPVLFTVSEFRFLRKHLGYSGKDFAAVLGKTPETVSRWENGKIPIDPLVDRLLRFMIMNMQRVPPIDALKKLRTPKRSRRLIVRFVPPGFWVVQRSEPIRNTSSCKACQ